MSKNSLSKTIATFINSPEINGYKSLFPNKLNPLYKSGQVQQWKEELRQCCTDEIDFESIWDTSFTTSACWPHCDQINRFELLLKTTVIIFFLDDLTDISHADYGTAQKHWQNYGSAFDIIVDKELVDTSHWEPYLLLSFSVFEKIFQDFTAEQQKRSARLMKESIEAQIGELDAFKEGIKSQSYDYMIQLRFKNSTIKPWLQFCEYANCLTLTDEEFDDPLMQEFLDVTTFAAIYDNDIFSLEKELNQMNGKIEELFNVIAFKVVIQGLDIEEAIRVTLKELLQFERRSLELYHQIISDNKNSYTKKAFAISVLYVAGGITWCDQNIPRYTGEKN